MRGFSVNAGRSRPQSLNNLFPVVEAPQWSLAATRLIEQNRWLQLYGWNQAGPSSNADIQSAFSTTNHPPSVADDACETHGLVRLSEHECVAVGITHDELRLPVWLMAQRLKDCHFSEL